MSELIKVKLQEKESFVCSFIGWERFQGLLIKSGELRNNESITHIEVNHDGIQYFITDAEKTPIQG